MVTVVALPSVDRGFGDPDVDAERLEKVPQRMDGEPVLLAAGRDVQAPEGFQKILVEPLGVDPVPAVWKLIARPGGEEPRVIRLFPGLQQGAKSRMDRHFPRLPGLGLGAIA